MPDTYASSIAARSIYHLTSCGDRQEAIIDDDRDREAFLKVNYLSPE